MRIAHVCMTFGSGGVGLHVKHLTRELTDMGHENAVFCLRPVVDHNQVRSISLGDQQRWGTPFLWSAKFNLMLSKVLYRKDFDVVQGNPVLGSSVRVARRAGLPYVTTLHGSLKWRATYIPTPSGLYSWWNQAYSSVNALLEERDYIESDASVFVSNDVREQFHELYGGRERVHVIPPCVDLSELSQHLNDGSRHGHEQSPNRRVIFVGSLTHVKGVPLLLQAFQRLKTSLPNVELVIIGPGRNDRINSLTEHLGIQDCVRFLGQLPRQEVLRYLRESDLLMCSSLYESFGIVLLEAMASGLPVVAFESPGVRELVLDGKTGILVPPYDFAALAKAALELLEDEDKRLHISRQAKKLTSDRYSARSVAESYERVYASVC